MPEWTHFERAIFFLAGIGVIVVMVILAKVTEILNWLKRRKEGL